MPRYSLAKRIAAAKRFGLAVEVVPGAETRGSASYAPGCYVGHNTAGAKVGDRPSLNLCVVGRSDLAGPLCEDFMPRRGGLVIVACGRSNNAGLGGFRGIVGNSGTMACEAEDDGDGKWTDAQIRDYPRIVASGLWMLGRDATWYCSHRTWALVKPSWPGRKVDPVGISDEWQRAWVAALLKNPTVVPHAGMPGTIPVPTEETDMPLTPKDADVLLAGHIEIPKQYQKEYGLSVYTVEQMLFSAQYHAQEGHQQLDAFVRASTARETALVDLVTKLANSAGLPVTVAELQAMLDSSTAKAVADLDLHLTTRTDPAGNSPAV